MYTMTSLCSVGYKGLEYLGYYCKVHRADHSLALCYIFPRLESDLPTSKFSAIFAGLQENFTEPASATSASHAIGITNLIISLLVLSAEDLDSHEKCLLVVTGSAMLPGIIVNTKFLCYKGSFMHVTDGQGVVRTRLPMPCSCHNANCSKSE